MLGTFAASFIRDIVADWSDFNDGRGSVALAAIGSLRERRGAPANRWSVSSHVVSSRVHCALSATVLVCN